MLNIRLQIQQNFNYIIAEINKTAQNNKVIEANKKEETVREKLKKFTKTCKYVDQCKYMSSKTCRFLQEQTNSTIELSEDEEWKILFTWANFSGETETLNTSDSEENKKTPVKEERSPVKKENKTTPAKVEKDPKEPLPYILYISDGGYTELHTLWKNEEKATNDPENKDSNFNSNDETKSDKDSDEV